MPILLKLHCLYAVICFAVIIEVMSVASIAKAQIAQPSRSAIQTIYRNSVPHTDKNGRLLTEYDSQQSFFQIGMWGVPLPGITEGYFYDWNLLKNAGFNTMWTYHTASPQFALRGGALTDMQVVLMSPPSVTGRISDTDLAAIRDNPDYRSHLFGNLWWDEPTTTFPLNEMQTHYDRFLAHRDHFHSYLPETPVFIDDAPAFVNGNESALWWAQWARGSDTAVQDNYPIRPTTTSIGKNNGPPGIPESISRAVDAVGQQKPVWAIVGAFSYTNPDTDPFPFRFATPVQMRAQVYSSIIHGATGIVYFIWDSYISRAGGVIGIAPEPRAEGYSPTAFQQPATLEQLQKSVELWNSVSAINQELISLSPAILSPTVSPDDLSYNMQLSNLSAPNNTALYSNTPIRTLLKRDQDGSYILMAVNLDNRSLDVTFRFSDTFNQIGLLFEDSGVLSALSKVNEFTYHFEPYDSNVFVLSVCEPNSASLGLLLMIIICFYKCKACRPLIGLFSLKYR